MLPTDVPVVFLTVSPTIWVPDRFPNRSQPIFELYPDKLYRTCTRQNSRPGADSFHGFVRTRNQRFTSRPVRQITPHFPASSHLTVSKRDHFPILSLWNTQNEVRLRRANRFTSSKECCLRYRAYMGFIALFFWFVTCIADKPTLLLFL